MPELPPLSDEDAVAVVKRVAARYESGVTRVLCNCSACDTGVRASRTPDGLCDGCRASGCNPYLGRVECRPKED